MKYLLIIAFIIIMSTAISFGQAANVEIKSKQNTNVQLPCGSFKEVKEFLNSRDEKVVFVGQGQTVIKGKTVPILSMISLNKDTGTWSYLESYTSGVICLIAAGAPGKLHSPALLSNI